MRKPGCSKLVVPICLAVLCLAPAGSALPPVSEVDISADSELELLERADAGAYQRYGITVAISDETCTLATDKDGSKASGQVPLEECLTAWREILVIGLEGLTDPSPEGAPPDQSHFKVAFRVRETKGGFEAYGVDSLPDTRYRDVVRVILAFANARVARLRAPTS